MRGRIAPARRSTVHRRASSSRTSTRRQPRTSRWVLALVLVSRAHLNRTESQVPISVPSCRFARRRAGQASLPGIRVDPRSSAAEARGPHQLRWNVLLSASIFRAGLRRRCAEAALVHPVRVLPATGQERGHLPQGVHGVLYAARTAEHGTVENLGR